MRGDGQCKKTEGEGDGVHVLKLVDSNKHYCNMFLAPSH